MKTLQTTYGVFTLLNGDTTEDIPYQNVVEKHLYSDVNDCSTVVVVGSGNGILDIYLARINSGISVYSFEPREACFCVINKNIQDNKVENVMVMHNALGHMTGPINIDFEEDDRVHCDHDDVVELANGRLVGFNKQVVFVTLDSLNLLSCDLIVVNLSGFDYITIAGALQTIQKFKPVVVFRKTNGEKLHSLFGIQDKNAQDLLERLGYKMSTIDNGMVLARPNVSRGITYRENSALQSLHQSTGD
jgi:FkbM family methyltransferase